MDGRAGRRARRALTAIAMGGVVAPEAAHAQTSEGLPDVQDVVIPTQPAQCAGEVVQEIVVYSSAPTVAGARRFPVLAEIARSTHVTTQPGVIRRYLLFREGETCTELRRAESERVLRAQPFIADATISTVPVVGGVRVEVRTIDEAAFIVGTRMHSGQPFLRSLRLGNGNLGGEALHVAGEWRAGGVLRDGAALTATHHQFLGQPYVLRLHGRRAPLGGEWETELFRPFLTGLQRHAWRVGGGQLVGYTHLEHPEAPTRAVRIERRFTDAGAMARVGPPTLLGLLGTSISHEYERGASTFTAFAPNGVPFQGEPLADPSASYESTRVNALVGIRALSFVRAAGFDALDATQDLATGVQAGVVVGRSIGESDAGGTGRELFLAADIYAGKATVARATRVQLRAQGARSPADGDWGRVLATGRIAHQVKPSSGRTVEASGEWSLAWRPGVPLQLLLGGRDGGVRGYDHARTGGARRVSVRLEERRVIGRVGTFGDVGLASFADAGRVWRGDSPFGVTTPVRTSVGLGLLAAVPARSARLWRLDLAVPLQGSGAGRVELRLSNADRTSVFWREPGEIAGMRDRTVPASVFAWP